MESSESFHANSRNSSKGILKMFEGRFTLRDLYHPGWMIDGHCYMRRFPMLLGLGGRTTQASRAMSMCVKLLSTTSFTTWRTHWEHDLACLVETLIQLNLFL